VKENEKWGEAWNWRKWENQEGSLVYTVFSRPFLAESKSYCSKVALPIMPDSH